MGVPSNLGQNSSVFFQIRRFQPKIIAPPMTTTEQQNIAYKMLEKQAELVKPQKQSVAQQLLNIANDVLTPTADGATYLEGLLQRANQTIGQMSHQQRQEYFRTEEGATIQAELLNIRNINEQVGDIQMGLIPQQGLLAQLALEDPQAQSQIAELAMSQRSPRRTQAQLLQEQARSPLYQRGGSKERTAPLLRGSEQIEALDLMVGGYAKREGSEGYATQSQVSVPASPTQTEFSVVDMEGAGAKPDPPSS